MSLKHTLSLFFIAVLIVTAWLLFSKDLPMDGADAIDQGFPSEMQVDPVQQEAAIPEEVSPDASVGDSLERVAVTHEREGEPKISAEASIESIMQLMPAWLIEAGDVHRERVRVSGHWVDRVRSRYIWANESQVEVEVSDLGKDASEEQFKALGFDFNFEVEGADGARRMIADGGDFVSNLEYSEEDASGFVQYIVAGRYLMEIQLENLPLESFQTLEDRDGLFQVLLVHASLSVE